MALGNTTSTQTPIILEARKSYALGLWFQTKQDRDSSPEPADITGATIRFVVRAPAREGGAIVLDKNADIVLTTLGYAVLRVQASEVDLDPGTYPYSLTMLTSEGYSMVILKGSVEILENTNPENTNVFPLDNPAEALTIDLKDNEVVTVFTRRYGGEPENPAETLAAITPTLSATYAALEQRAEFPLSKFASLQDAIDTASAAGGGVVTLPAGATPVSGKVSMKSKVTIAGPPCAPTVWGYNTTPESFHTAWLQADNSTVDPVIEFGTLVAGAGLRDVLIKASGRLGVNMPDSTTRGGNRLDNVAVNGGGIYLGQREVRGSTLIVMLAPGDGITVAGQDCDLDHVLTGFCGGTGFVLAIGSGPARIGNLDTFMNAVDGLRINGDGHKIGRVQANDNQRRGVAWLTATNSLILDLAAVNNSRETLTVPANHYPDVDFAHPTAGNLGCGVIGGKIANDGLASHGVETNEAGGTSYPLLMGVTLGGSYQSGTSPFALANPLTSFRIRGCVGVPDVIAPQGSVATVFRPNGSSDIVQIGNGSGGVYFGVTSGGQVYDTTLGFVDVGDVRIGTTVAAFSVANRTLYARVLRGGLDITKIGLEVGVQSGNISVAVYRNSGVGRAAAPSTRVASSGTISCPAPGYAEVALGATVRVNPGDWLALSCDNTTATFKRWADSTSVAFPNLVSGLSARQDVHPAPATPASLLVTGTVPCLIGVP